MQQNRPHSHHLVQIVWSVELPVQMTSSSDEVEHAPGHVVAGDASHHLCAEGPLRLLFFDPDFWAAEPWSRYAARGARALTAEKVEQLESCLAAWRAADETESSLSPSPSPSREDRHDALMAWLGERLHAPLRARDAASAMGLSEGHFLHWFSKLHGLPFRPYVRWLRVQHVLSDLAAGKNLTEAAHAAGFADSAHLTRTFVSTFGIAPSQLKGVSIELRLTAGPDLSTVLLA